MFEDEEDDDDYLGLTEVERWFDNNQRYFYRKEGQFPEFSLEVELFYKSVYLPFMTDLKKPVREMVYRDFPLIANEMRPEVLAKIDDHINWVGHEFILFLHQSIYVTKLGLDLRKEYPKLDDWAIRYPVYRKPRYTDSSFWDQFDWLTEENKKQCIAESQKEADEIFELREKPRSAFFALLQTVAFKYYPDIQDLDSDGWVLYEVFLHDEYTNYQLDFEHDELFIDYGFDVEDLNLPYNEYSQQLAERMGKRLDEEFRRNESEQNGSTC